MARLNTTSAPDIEAPSDLQEPHEQLYWVGCLKNPCAQVLHVGGVDFPRFTEEPIPDPDHPGKFIRDDATGAHKMNRNLGRLVVLTRSQVARVKAAAPKRVLRIEGARAIRLSMESVAYSARPSDVPYSRFIYMIPCPPQGIVRASEPQPIDPGPKASAVA